MGGDSLGGLPWKDLWEDSLRGPPGRVPFGRTPWEDPLAQHPGRTPGRVPLGMTPWKDLWEDPLRGPLGGCCLGVPLGNTYGMTP